MKKICLGLTLLFLCSCSGTTVEEDTLFMGDEDTAYDQPAFSEIQPVEPTPFEMIEVEDEAEVLGAENIKIEDESFFAEENDRSLELHPVMITLQYTGRPTSFVQCLSTDEDCFKNYMEQGYRPLSHMPQFAGFKDVLSSSDYPGDNHWRDNNNIPRW